MQVVEKSAVGYNCDATITKHVYVDSKRWIIVFKDVYEPAEDTWLTLTCLEKLLKARKPLKLVDVGSGTGVIGLTILAIRGGGYGILIDINPCAVHNSLLNSRKWSLDTLIDVIQCDNISCIRSSWQANTVFIYNTPYLPVNDPTLEGLAWSGGLREALRLVDHVAEEASNTCLVLTYSSLSGDEAKLTARLARKGLKIICRVSIHMFFEDIVSVAACKP